MPASRSGLAAGVGAYLLWGLVPLYWPLLEPAGAMEMLAHRIVWSLVFLAALLAVTGGLRWVARLTRRQSGLLGLASVFIAINWGTFIYAVTTGHVVEISLGYFINPLVTVALAVVVLREGLRPLQWVAVAIATLAVVALTIDYGRLPWIALSLAFAFGLYGLVKKQVAIAGLQSVAAESALLVVPSLAFLVWLEQAGRGTFTTGGAGHGLLLAGSGVVTAVPLVLFAASANRIPLSTVGVLQYIAPVMQFLIGVLVFGEAMPASRLVGFGMVWLALSVFTFDALRAARRGARDALDPLPSPEAAAAR